jgi:two-component system, cell cycle sensor histidine kinase and response regulator CckA
VPPELRATDAQRLSRIVAEGKIPAFEMEIVAGDGNRVPVLLGGALLERGQEALGRRLIWFVLDLSARRELEERLQRAERTRSLAVMAGGIAHDFNNLLTTILGNTSLAMDQVPPRDARVHELLSSVVAAANRSAELVRDILMFTGQTHHQRKPVELSVLVGGMRGELAEMARGTAAELRFELAEGLPAVSGDASEIRQMLRKLFANAVEALGPEGGAITVRTAVSRLTPEIISASFGGQEVKPGSFAMLEVADTGCGMPEEVANRAFDPFYTTKFLGRGLGLASVQGMVRAHSGGIRMQTTPARGTRMEIFFPLPEPAP